MTHFLPAICFTGCRECQADLQRPLGEGRDTREGETQRGGQEDEKDRAGI